MKTHGTLLTAALLGGSFALLTLAAQAQTGVGIGTTTPHAAAALDISASGKGLLIPRMDSASRAQIASPPTGLLVFQTDGRTGFWYSTGGTWLYLPDKTKSGDNLGNHTATQNLNLGNFALTGGGSAGLRLDNTGRVGIGLSPGSTYKLQVSGGDTRLAATGAQQSLFGLDRLVGYDDLRFYADDAGSTERMRLTSSGSLWLLPGQNNTLVGYSTGPTVTGPYNTLVGYESGRSLTAGTRNTFVGQGSGKFLTDGSRNTFLGNDSGGNATGSNNTLLGNSSGSGVSGDNVTALGAASGVTNTGGGNNTYLGAGADATVGALTNATAIGYNAKVSQSNSLVLGSGARVGIGTSAPATTLHVAGGSSTVRLEGLGNGSSTRMLTAAADGTLGAQALPVDTDGQTLSVSGQSLTITGGNAVTLPNTAAGPGLSSTASGSTISVQLGGSALTAATDVPLAGHDLTFSGASGRVGIGTSSPSTQLDVSRSFQVGAGVAGPDQLVQQTSGSAGVLTNYFYGQSFTLPAGATVTQIDLFGGGASTFTLYQGVPASGSVLATQATSGGSITLATPVTVGAAGTYSFGCQTLGSPITSPFGNNNYAGGILYAGYDNTSSPADPSLDLKFAVHYYLPMAPALYAPGTGQVGIGTASPAATLHVGGSSSSVRLEGLAGSSTRVVTTAADGTLGSAAAASLDATTATNGLTQNGSAIVLGGSLTQATSISQGSFDLAFTGAGNVGIGTTPTAKLDVAGDVRSTSNFTYTTAKSRAITLEASAFRAGNARDTRLRTFGLPGVYISDGTLGTAGEVFATLTLPDGALITQVQAMCYDVDPTYDLSVSLDQVNIASFNVTTLATTNSTTGTSAGGYGLTATVPNTPVDNTSNLLRLRINTVERSNGIGVFYVRVSYTVSRAD